MEWFKGLTVGFLVLCTFVGQAKGVQIVTTSPNARCEEKNLRRELIVYRDPELLKASLGAISADPAQVREIEDGPIITTLIGRVELMLEPAEEYKNFGWISRLYQKVEPRLKAAAKKADQKEKRDKASVTARKPELITPTMIMKLKICGGSHDFYRDTIGFVLASDLREAEIAESEDGSLPPSVHFIPVLKN